ncbi:MAG: flagellar hook-associated protein FlgK [Anaerovoracaceae bacterium]|jgi:flagellar hook-associated protein 1 FlgK
MSLRPTFLAFHTASRALAASQANMDVTGNNIANVNTKGYTRQRVDLNSISSGGYTQKYAVPTASVGLGVEVSRISQIRDPFLDARYRDQASENGRFDTVLAGLTDLENIFDEISTEGLLHEISKFVNSLQSLAQTPAASDIALVARTAAQKVTQIMNVYAKQITQVRNQQVFDLSKVVIDNDFNTKVKSIADLNVQIREEQTYGNVPNELLDKRNMLIDELAELANIKVTSYPERISEDLVVERLTVSLYDTATGTSIGLVDGGLYNTLYVNDDGDRVTIGMASSFGPHGGADITHHFSSGSIRGYLDLINGGGINEFRGVPYYRNSMDILASNFARVLNDLNTIDPADPKPLFSAAGGGPITAENIRISEQWLADPTFITTTRGNANAGDNILRMISAIDSETVFYKDAEDSSSQVMFRGSFDEFMSGLMGEVALDVELYMNYSDTSVTVLSNLFAARESISGVNLDEEGINLMAFQKSYNAAARYFTALDEAVDTIINRMGIVGR